MHIGDALARARYPKLTPKISPLLKSVVRYRYDTMIRVKGSRFRV
jgi:hypothetical protein